MSDDLEFSFEDLVGMTIESPAVRRCTVVGITRFRNSDFAIALPLTGEKTKSGEDKMLKAVEVYKEGLILKGKDFDGTDEEEQKILAHYNGN